MSRRSSLDCKVYIGELSREATERDVERAFEYYGPVKSVWVARNPPGFAFVEYDDTRDAEDAVRGLDGSRICGRKIRVEMSTGKTRPKPWMRSAPPPSMRRPFHPDDKCYQCGERGHYAYDCHRYRRRESRRSHRSRSRTRSRTRSRSRDYRRRSRSYTRSRSHSYDKRDCSKSRTKSRSKSRSRTRSHSDSPRRSTDREAH